MQSPWLTPGNPELSNTVHRWMPSDTEANWLARGRPSIYDDTSFDYRYNEFGFRCDSMADALYHGNRMLLAGCSVTEGIGLPVDATWGHRLVCKVRDALGDPGMPHWCVARGGVSQDWIARQLCLMLPILRPRVVIAHLPDPGRREVWHGGRLHGWCPGDLEPRGLSERVVPLMEDDQIVHESQRAIMMMHMACRAHGAWLHWHVWLHGPRSDEIYRRIRLGLPDEVRAGHYDSSPGGGDVARDGMHGGPISQAAFADALWEEINGSIIPEMQLTDGL